jgi:hypothetical protein
MITVAILINGQPPFARSAINKLKETGYYIGDDGGKIKHNPEDGAVKLAIKMLKTIKEVK